MRRGALLAVAPALTLVLLVFFAPLALLLSYSLLGYAGCRVVSALTLGHYTALVTDPFYLRIIGRTFAVALTTTLLSVVLGYPIAWQIARTRSRLRPLMVLAVVAPLLVGGVIRGYGWMLILDDGGLANGLLVRLGMIAAPTKLLFNFTGLVITMVEVMLPFFVLPLVGVLSNLDPALERAALSMGASRLQTFLEVTLPLSLVGVVGGASIVFSLAANIFVIPRIIGGPSYLLMSTLAYQQIGSVGNWPFGSAVATFMLAATLAVLVVGNRALIRRFGHQGAV
ncbi:MAG: ABC transporter permease [Candidatus Rokubacteria bacterium]|nr:ABC transporter permease [Candidatus Rokubacteria bacterium]